jgi:hypothetical protein
MYEIHKCITNITSYPQVRQSTNPKKKRKKPTILEIHPQIKKINPPRTNPLNKRNQIPIAHLVRDILDHHRRARVEAVLDAFDVQLVALAWGNGSRGSIIRSNDSMIVVVVVDTQKRRRRVGVRR